MNLTGKPLCVIQAPVFSRSGYGDLSTDIAKSMIRNDKYDVLIAPTRWGGCPPKSVDEKDPENQVVLSKFLRENLNKQPDLFIQISIPNEFQAPGKYNIGITAGIETTVPRADWIEGVNRMHLTLATSQFAKNGLVQSSYTKNFNDGSGRTEQLVVNKPVEVLFWGANTNIYKKTDERNLNVEEALKSIPENFCFLFVGQWTHGNGCYSDRKDIGNLIKTFCTAFKDKALKPALVLKTSGVNFSVTDKYDMIKKIKTVTEEVGGDIPNVYLLHGELSDVEMNALFNHEKVKAHISFTHGEGFGHPLLLASLSGKPLLVSNWSGHLDFLNPKYTTFLDGTVAPIAPESVNEWLVKEGSWFTVSYSLAEDKIRDMFYHYGKKTLERSDLLRVENAEKFSLQSMDKTLWSLLDKYVPVFATEKKIVLPKLRKIELPKLKKLDTNITSSVQR